MYNTGEVLRGVLLDYRWHTYPDKSYINNFDLIDETTGAVIPYDLIELSHAFEPVDFAPQRMGLSHGTKRYGFFEDPAILRYDIRFIASDIPAHGYKAYRLKKNSTAVESKKAESTENIIENEYYKITADFESKQIISIYDKEAERELVDKNGGGFYRFVVRVKNSIEEIHSAGLEFYSEHRKTYSKIGISTSYAGHPVIRHNIRLYAGIKNIYFETSVFKDPTPLLNAHLAFPLKADNPQFSYESALSIMEPVKDYLPGAYSDLIAVQNWVRIQDGDYYMLWSSLDAPMAGFNKLWSGYVSPAHRCFVDESFRHDPQTEADYQQNGWIFSQLYNNNFGTNFAVSQTGSAVFRYCLTSGSGSISDFDAVKWGWQVSLPQASIFTDRTSPDGVFEPCGQFLECDNPDIVVLNWKAAEDGRGYIVRLWNVSDKAQSAALAFTGFTITAANLTDMVESDLPDGELKIDKNAFICEMNAKDIITVRVYLN
jgi:hypothetical protein